MNNCTLQQQKKNIFDDQVENQAEKDDLDDEHYIYMNLI